MYTCAYVRYVLELVRAAATAAAAATSATVDSAGRLIGTIVSVTRLLQRLEVSRSVKRFLVACLPA